jgi:DNA-binding Xre family transcriptional regulator
MIIVKPKLKKIIAEKQKKDSSFTQMKLANLADVPQAAISRFDRSENFNAQNLFAIARALHLNVEDLFEVTETDNKKNDV